MAIRCVVSLKLFVVVVRLSGSAQCLGGHSHTETPSSLSSVSEMEELMCALDLGERVTILPKLILMQFMVIIKIYVGLVKLT